MMTKERRAELEALADEDPHMCLLRELLNEIMELEARAVVVPEYPENDFAIREAIRNAGGDPDFDQCIHRAGWFDLSSRLRAIPADRVLGEGMVQVDREEFDSATRWTFNGIDIHKVEHKEGFWFAVRRGNSCMSRSGEWDLEPLPSSRTPEFFAEFRFDSFRSALMALRANQGGAAT